MSADTWGSGGPSLPRPLAHAYIIAGGSAASRGAFARRLAQAYVCTGREPPCLKCRDCRKVEEGVHPDVSFLSPAEGKKEIVVDQARALRADAYVRPNEAGRKVYIIDPADSLNAAAQNTLLKVLEEGPPYAAFLLAAARPGELLATLRSRCETLKLPPEEEEAPDPALREKGAELARLLLGEDELELAGFLTGPACARLKSGEVLDLFGYAEEALAPELRIQPRKAAALLEQLRAFRGMRPYNVGAGHLLGALAAGWGEK